MSLIQLIYQSAAAPGLAEPEILDILKKSQEKNLAKRISGLLVFRGDRFIQLLEGEEAEVMALFERIAADPRHADVQVIKKMATERVAMPTWAMAYFSPTVTEAARSDNPAILTEEVVGMICESLPEQVRSPFFQFLQG